MIDLNPNEISGWEAHLSSGKSCYAFCWIASLQSRPDTMGLSLACIHSLAEDGSHVDAAVRSPALSCVIWGGRTHTCDAEYLIQGYPYPTFQQHSSHVKTEGSSFSFQFMCFWEWIPDEAGSGGAAMTTACAQLPPHQPQLYLTPPSQGGKSRSMTPLSALISTFLYNFSKAKTLLNLFYCMLSMISGGSVLSNTLARKNKR